MMQTLIRRWPPRVKHFRGKLEENYLHSISDAHLNKLPIEYEWWSHLDNDKHILGLIKGCAGWSEVLKVPRAHVSASLKRCRLRDQLGVSRQSWSEFLFFLFFFQTAAKQSKKRTQFLPKSNCRVCVSQLAYLAWSHMSCKGRGSGLGLALSVSGQSKSSKPLWVMSASFPSSQPLSVWSLIMRLTCVQSSPPPPCVCTPPPPLRTPFLLRPLSSLVLLERWLQLPIWHPPPDLPWLPDRSWLIAWRSLSSFLTPVFAVFWQATTSIPTKNVCFKMCVADPRASNSGKTQLHRMT